MDLDTLEAELGTEALIALRDKLLARVPVTAAHPAVKSLDRAHVMAERQRASFDAAHKPPSEGPVADALKRYHDRQRIIAEQREAAARLGRYYVEGYRDENGSLLWRVQDRYTARIAFFALDDPQQPARLEGYRDMAEAIARIHRLDDHFNSLGCGIGPRSIHLDQSQLVAGNIQQYISPPAPPPAVRERRKRAAMIVAEAKPKQPGRNTVHRIVPDRVWVQVAALIPAEPAGKQTSKPRTTCNRTALAGILLYLRSTSGWHSIPPSIGCSPMLCRKRLEEWKAAGAWPKIEDALYELLNDRQAISWDKASGEPLATKKARFAIIRRVERYRQDRELSVCDISRAVFGNGTTYKRILDGAQMREATRLRFKSYLESVRNF